MSEWISTAEKRPPNGEMVLVCRKAGDVHFAESVMINNGIGWGWMGTAANSDPRACYPYWMPLPDPPAPKLTAKEALREAIAALQDSWGYALQLSSEKDDFGCLIDITDEFNEVPFKTLLPRLRAALEGEE